MEDLNPRHHDNVEILRKHIEGIEIAMLSTVSPHGRLHSRPMATQEVAFDGDLWFFASRSTQLPDEIRHSPHVNLSYSTGRQRHDYVSVSGTAELVDDRAKAAELWRPMYKEWFPRGLDDPNLVLLKIHVDRAEIWESPIRSVVRFLGLRNNEPSSHEHQRLDLTGTG